jgi:hypothetical protein
VLPLQKSPALKAIRRIKKEEEEVRRSELSDKIRLD